MAEKRLENGGLAFEYRWFVDKGFGRGDVPCRSALGGKIGVCAAVEKKFVALGGPRAHPVCVS